MQENKKTDRHAEQSDLVSGEFTFDPLQSRDLLILGAIILIAALLRIVSLNEPLWYDEIYSLMNFVRAPFFKIVSEDFDFNNHLLYNIQAKAAIFLFGEYNWSFRLPALLFGVAGIAAMWWLAQSVAGTIVAHSTAALIALSYHHIWFSQNARGYTELMFYGVASTVVFVVGMKSSKWQLWLLYAALIGLAFYTHLTAGFLVAAHGIVYLSLLAGRHYGGDNWPLSFRAPATFSGQLWPVLGFALGGIITLLLYAPLLPEVIELMSGVKSGSQTDVMPEYQNPLWTLIETARSVSNAGWVMAVGLPAALVLSLIGIVAIWRREPILAAIIAVHIPLTFAILIALSMRIWPRFFFADLGFIFLAITYGVFVSCHTISEQLRNWFGIALKQRSVFALSVFLMLAISMAIASRNYQFPKQNLEGAHEFVEARRSDDSAVLTLGWSAIPFSEYFTPHWTAVETVDEFVRLKDQIGQTWVVFGFPERTRRKYVDIVQVLEREFVVEKIFRGTLGDGDVVVYLRKDSPGS